MYIAYITYIITSYYIYIIYNIIYIIGIQDLKFKQGAELLDRTYTLSTNFKTASTYGYQPVLASEDFKKLLRIYLTVFRPLAVLNSKNPNANSDDYNLFLTYEGEPETRLSRLVSLFFRYRMGLHITPTTLRAIMESTVADRLHDGTADPEECFATSHVNGHSITTRDMYYKRRSVEGSVRTVLVRRDPQNVLLTTPPLILTARDWGTEHPDSDNPDATRVPFSPAELAYMTQLITVVPQNSANFVARCLKKIVADANATPIFHKRHIFNTDRLRSGFRSNFVTTGDGKYLPMYSRQTV